MKIDTNKLQKVNLKEGEYYDLVINNVIFSIKKEKEGYVIDLYDKNSKLLDTTYVWDLEGEEE